VRQSSNQSTPWLTLSLVSAIPRLLGALFLPNAFGDAYVYIRDIGTMSTKMRAGAFTFTDLYGFWLPLYQFISALPNVVIGNGFYSGKLVAAVFGAAVCLLVYQLTLQLTAHRTAALLAFLLIALNPLHIFYSASAMTDVPHAFFVLASLYFCLRQRWIPAAAMAALAGLTRMESWMFIALIPAIQFVQQRRVSIIGLVILAIPPLFWFYISWRATGNWLACFVARRQYHDWLLTVNPTLAHFSLSRIIKDTATLLVSADLAVLIAAFVAGYMVCAMMVQKEKERTIHEITRQKQKFSSRVFAAVSCDFVDRGLCSSLIFWFAFFGLLVVAYLAHQQPIIFPRYGLILFSLGIPILAWTFLRLRQHKPQWARRLFICTVSICLIDASIQLVGSVGLLNQISTQRAVANYLHAHFEPGSNAHIFCEDGTVQAMSGISAERFLTSLDAPKDRETFIGFLKENEVKYLVFIKNADSTPAKLFPDAESEEPESFDLVMHSYTDFLPMDIWLYQIRQPGALARP